MLVVENTYIKTLRRTRMRREYTGNSVDASAVLVAKLIMDTEIQRNGRLDVPPLARKDGRPHGEPRGKQRDNYAQHLVGNGVGVIDARRR